ncbi:MAG: two-component system response regulator [Candidatus Cloacimonas sp. SDB]|nr:MAG: two-component system response regulator [Candidatus Cloacimonas sp. SDB]
MTIKRAFKDIDVTNRIDLVGNGEEALEFLRNEENERPALIFLDLNMPKMNGIEFLRILRQDDQLNMIPVIILTTSKDEHDKVDSFKLGIAGYIVKPVDYMQFVEVIKTIKDYWTFSELPK